MRALCVVLAVVVFLGCGAAFMIEATEQDKAPACMDIVDEAWVRGRLICYTDCKNLWGKPWQ